VKGEITLLYTICSSLQSRKGRRSMDKEEIQQSLNQSWERIDTLRDLRSIVEEIDSNIPGERTKEMMYALVDVVIQLSERVHDLELRVVPFDARGELSNREEKYRVDSKKRDTTNLYRQKRDGKPRIL